MAQIKAASKQKPKLTRKRRRKQRRTQQRIISRLIVVAAGITALAALGYVI